MERSYAQSGKTSMLFSLRLSGGGRVSPVIFGYTVKLVLNRMEKEMERGRGSSVLESVMCYYTEDG